jgi:hypothetical protein
MKSMNYFIKLEEITHETMIESNELKLQLQQDEQLLEKR